MKKKLATLFALLLFLGGGAFVYTENSKEITFLEQSKEGTIEVHYIDVGQGDATLIKYEDYTMLIDAGDDSKGPLIVNYLKNQGVDSLDYLVVTHPDADHCGGADNIITKFDIGTVIMPDIEKETSAYDDVMDAMAYRGYQVTPPIPGDQYAIGDAFFTILGPVEQEYANTNDYSVALKLSYGKNSFLFTGDAEETAEEDMQNSGRNLDAQVYQVGHHGSRSSSSPGFLAAVSPEYVVISCAEGNDYGHPHAQTMNYFRTMDFQVFRTDEQGTIVAIADGNRIKWNSAVSDSWLSGEPKNSVSEVLATPITAEALTYVCNIKSMKFHYVTCTGLPTINRKDTTSTREELLDEGFTPCGGCNP